MGTLRVANFALHSDGDNRDGSMTWSTMADVVRPPRALFLQDDESEVESNGGCGEAPHIVLSWWRLRGSLRGVESSGFHSVRWSVVLQRHYSVGSRMAMAFLVRCSLFLLDPCCRSITLGGLRRLHESEIVGGCCANAFRLSHPV